MPQNITSKAICPICNQQIVLDLNRDFIEQSERFPVQFLIEHCNQSLIIYVDRNYEVKGIESIDNILERREYKTQNNHIPGEPINSDFFDKMSSEEKLILSSNYDLDYIKEQQFPNVLEKQIILQIAKFNRISVAVLLQKLSGLEKALNRKIDQDSLLKITDKYVERGIISKEKIRYEKEKSNFNDLNINLRGDIY
ncbi:MAG: hypothetical protein ACFFBH_13910 [Promethearchaeota archaeon]